MSYPNGLILSKNEEEFVENVRRRNAEGFVAGGMPAPNKKGELTRDEKRCLKLIKLGVLFFVGVGARTERGHTGGRGLIAAENFDPAKHNKLDNVTDDVSKYPFEGLTVRQAIELFPGLLNEPLIAGSGDHDDLNQVKEVTFQFFGDKNYRTGKLARKDKS